MTMDAPVLTSVSVSCAGDDKFKDLLRTLSLRKGIPQGELVRVALDRVFGQDLAAIALFFGYSDAYQPHLMPISAEMEQSDVSR